MTGSEIVQVINLVLTALVSIVALVVRARVVALEGEVRSLNVILKAANIKIISQGLENENLEAEVAMLGGIVVKAPPSQTWQGNPPYKPGK